MTTAALIVSSATWIGLLVLGLAFLLTVWRVVAGPTLPDRVVALDTLVGIVIGFIALIAIRTGFTLYIDIAISLGLVGFLATVAFARFILARGREDQPSTTPPLREAEPSVIAPAQARKRPAGRRQADSSAAPRRRKSR